MEAEQILKKDKDSFDLHAKKMKKLAEIQQFARDWYKYFQENYNNAQKSRSLIFKNSVDNDQKAAAAEYQITPLSFNILESFISEACGDFSQSEPGVVAEQSPDGKPVDPETLKAVGGHESSILLDFHKNGGGYYTFRNQLSTGMAAVKISTKYVSEYSFNQDIDLETAEVEMCVFDVMAKDPHKGDGRACGEFVHMDYETFIKEHPEYENKFNFDSPLNIGEGIEWAYNDISRGKKVVVKYYHYEKCTEKFNLVLLQDIPQPLIPYDRTMTEKDYNKLVLKWREKDLIVDPPKIIKTEKRKRHYIKRYEIVQNDIIDIIDVDFDFLPIVFFDGNSTLLKRGNATGQTYQFTRPLVYQAMDTQFLKNLIGQQLAYNIENYDGVEFVCAEETIPTNDIAKDNWRDMKNVKTLYYKSMDFTEAGVQQLPPPIPRMRLPFPNELIQMYMALDQSIQNILGASDINQQPGNINNPMSAVAMIESKLQKNKAVKPYIVNYMISLNYIADCILRLIPRYYTLPRTIKVLDAQGKSQTQQINKPGYPQMNFRPEDLNIVVKAGLNFEGQQQKALETLTTLAQSNPAMGALINGKGLPVLLDNINIRGIEFLKEIANEELKQKQNQPPAPPPEFVLKQQEIQNKFTIEQGKLALQKQELQIKQEVESLKLQIDMLKEENRKQMESMKVHHSAASDHVKMMNEGVKAHVEMRKAEIDANIETADLALRATEEAHSHERELMRINHELTKQNKIEESQGV